MRGDDKYKTREGTEKRARGEIRASDTPAFEMRIVLKGKKKRG